MTAPVEDSGPPWINEHHVLHAGMLAGSLSMAGFRVVPVHDQDGSVTPILNLEKDGYSWAVIVMPPGSTADSPEKT